MLVDVPDDPADLLLVVSERRRARGTVWLTMDMVPPPTSFFVFTRPRSGSTPVVSQSMSRPMVPVGARTLAWALRTPYCSAISTALSQASWAAERTSGGTSSSSMREAASPVHPQDPEHGVAILLEACEGAHPCGRPGRSRVGVPCDERGDSRGPGPAAVGVVGKAQSHEEGPEVGVADAQLAETTGVLGDLLRRVVGVAHDDLLRGEHHLGGRLEACDIEGAVLAKKVRRLRLARLHAELSMCMYSLQGLLALMRPVFGAVCHRLMVVSNCMPGSAHSHDALCDLAEEVPRRQGLYHLSGGDRPQRPVRSSKTACMNSSVTRTELLAF